MARNQVSKSKRKSTPGLTKNGKIKLSSVSTEKLNDMLSKAQRPRDKDKIDRAIKYRAANGK